MPRPIAEPANGISVSQTLPMNGTATNEKPISANPVSVSRRSPKRATTAMCA